MLRIFYVNTYLFFVHNSDYNSHLDVNFIDLIVHMDRGFYVLNSIDFNRHIQVW